MVTKTTRRWLDYPLARFLVADNDFGTRAAIFGRALVAVNAAWNDGRGKNTVSAMIQTLLQAYAGGAIGSAMLLSSPPPWALSDLPAHCIASAWSLFFGSAGLFGAMYNSPLGQVFGVVLESMFRANLVVTFTVKGRKRLKTLFGPIACGVAAATGGAWLKEGLKSAEDLDRPTSPMFVALIASIGTLYTTNASAFRCPVSLTPKQAQLWVVLLMIAAEYHRRCGQSSPWNQNRKRQ